MNAGVNPGGDAVNDNDDLPAPSLAEAAQMLAHGSPARVTLSLDPARHRRLRVACAVSGRSAQAIMMQALDTWLDGAGGIDRPNARAMADGGGYAATGRGTE